MLSSLLDTEPSDTGLDEASQRITGGSTRHTAGNVDIQLLRSLGPQSESLLTGTLAGSILPGPALLLFLHLPKTGGSSAVSIVSSLPGWRRHCPHWHGHRYGGLIVSALAEPLGLSVGTRAANSTLFAWRQSRVLVEFHLPEEFRLFQRKFRPRLDALASVYRRAGGHFFAATFVREPLAQTRSHFAYFHVFGGAFARPKTPPTWRTNASAQIAGFARWLASEPADPQTKLLAHGAPAAGGGGDDVGTRAQATLGALGGVGISESFERSMQSLLTRIGVLPACHLTQLNLSAAVAACANGARHRHLLADLPADVRALLGNRTRAASEYYALHASARNALLALPAAPAAPVPEVTESPTCRQDASPFRVATKCNY